MKRGKLTMGVCLARKDLNKCKTYLLSSRCPYAYDSRRYEYGIIVIVPVYQAVNRWN